MSGPKYPPQTREQTGSPAADRSESVRNELARFLRACPFIAGKLKSVRFSVGGAMKVVSHRLGVPAACIVVRMNYEPTMNGPTFTEWSDQSGLDPNNQIALAASDVCDVDLWFYPRASKPIDLTTLESA